MQHVSSNLTLPLKLFLPIFWLVFFGLLTISAWVVSPEKGGALASWDLRLGITAFFITGAALLYFTLLKLKRVEADHAFIFATNYIKSARYPWSNVEKIVQQQFLSLPIVYIHLKTPGYFGRRFVFLGSRSRWQSFLEKSPEIASKVEVL